MRVNVEKMRAHARRGRWERRQLAVVIPEFGVLPEDYITVPAGVEWIGDGEPPRGQLVYGDRWNGKSWAGDGWRGSR